MPLRNILQDISSAFGIKLDNTEELAYTLTKVNEAAEELYGSCDLPGSLLEQVFQHTNEDTGQVSLPYYVGHVRGMRYVGLNARINIKDMRPRYHRNAWKNVDLLNYRIKSTSAALGREIKSGGQLTLTLAKVESAPVTVDLVCQTQYSESIKESLTIAAGDLTVTSTLVPVEVKSLVKTTGPSAYNITVTDINGRVLAEIPNSEVSPCYTIVQVRDSFVFSSFTDTDTLTYEVLYKLRWKPFVNLSDEFPCPGCDKLIFWKFSEHYASYKEGSEERAILAAKKVEQLKGELFQNHEVGKDMDLEFGSNPFNSVQENLGATCRSGYYHGYHT